MFILVHSLDFEHLLEYHDDHDLNEIVDRYKGKATFRPVSGCEARQYVAAGRPHTTGLIVRSDGTAGRIMR